MLEQPDVTEFIIVAPIEKRDAIIRSKERFIDYLQRRFPGCAFHLATLSPIFDEPALASPEDEVDFIPLPVMNWISADGDSLMCKRVPGWKLAAIAAACAEFVPGISGSVRPAQPCARKLTVNEFRLCSR